jgi:hypothetical protein
MTELLTDLPEIIGDYPLGTHTHYRQYILGKV